MSDTVDGLLAKGQAALDHGDWSGARDAFRAVLDRADRADAQFGLAEAAWWLGDIDASIRSRERSFAAYRRQPEPKRAALAAILLCLDYRQQVGNPVAAAGWLARATRLIEEHAIDELRGWLLFATSFTSDDLESAERWAGEARELAHEAGDTDLELCALSEVGAVLVRQGRVAEGVRWLDEAMAGSLGGEGGHPGTVVFTSCMMITSCTDCAEFERAVHWVRETQRFAERYGCPFLYAECRIVLVELLGTGDWRQAEEEHARCSTWRRGRFRPCTVGPRPPWPSCGSPRAALPRPSGWWPISTTTRRRRPGWRSSTWSTAVRRPRSPSSSAGST
ncbi:MAG: tetratricopeptide repeat protein [Acidimicrobiales bacterium]